MRVMFTVAVLLSGIACTSKAEAQACDGDCNRCLVYARGECIKRGADPACEARRKRCLEERSSKGAPKSTTTAAPLPSVCLRHHGVRRTGDNAAGTDCCSTGTEIIPTVIAPAPKSAPTVIAPAPKSAPTAVPPAPTVAPAPRLVPARVYLRAADIPPALNWCIWRRGPSVQTDAGKSRTTAQDVHCLPRESCRHRKRCLALSHQAIQRSRSGPSTNQTQATH